jgi:hypothetical protein
MVAKFIRTIDLKNDSWQPRNYDKNFFSAPPSEDWTRSHSPEIDDIQIWEEIYYDPGVIGVYAAWNPFCEFYIIDRPFVKNQDKRFLKFYGTESSEKIQEIVKNYNIEIPVFTMKVN